MACPGGTYQDDVGQGTCKECDANYYNISVGAATLATDCTLALCDSSCDEGACVDCLLPSQIYAYMTTVIANTSFCSRLGIDSLECTWRDDSSAWRVGGLRAEIVFLVLYVLQEVVMVT